MKEEDYEEFISRKIATRGNIGMTYTERKKKKLDESLCAESAEAGIESDLESGVGAPRLSDEPRGNVTKAQVDAHNEFRRSQLQVLLQLEAETKEARGHIYYAFAPESSPNVIDNEEEKVELTEEDDFAERTEEGM